MKGESVQGTPRRVTYFFAYLGVLLLDVLVLDVALLFPRHSITYEWMNRLGIYVAIIIVIGLSMWAARSSIRPMLNPHAHFLRWYMRLFAVLVPILFTLKAWNRILQAFWLR